MSHYNKERLKEKVNALLRKGAKHASKLTFLLQQNPMLLFAVIGALLLSIFFCIAGEKPVPEKNREKHRLLEYSVPFEPEDTEMTGIKESVDPRDVWTARLENKVHTTKETLEQKIDASTEESVSEIAKISRELNELKEQLELQKQELDKNNQKINASNLNASLLNKQASATNTKLLTQTLGVYTKKYGGGKKSVEDYITSGSFARAVLMTGVVVGTGSNSVSNPEPVMLRLTDAGIFSKNLRTAQIQEAILIGDCSGDLSSQRAKCRLQTLSLKNRDGVIIEKPVNGWIVGEDSRYGIKGDVVDKSSDILRLAMLNGLLGGVSNFFQSQTTKGVFPISPITGQQNALSSMNTLKGGAYAGAGDAFSKMADFLMERFNSMTPQILIKAGREVDVVFQHGVDLMSPELDIKHEVGSTISDGNLNKGVNVSSIFGNSAKNNTNNINDNTNLNMNNFVRDLKKMSNQQEQVKGSRQEEWQEEVGDNDGF